MIKQGAGKSTSSEQSSQARGRRGRGPHPRLEADNLVIGQRVALCNDGNQVDPPVEAAHKGDVDGLEPKASERAKGSCQSAFKPSRVERARTEGGAYAWPVGWIK